MRFQHSPAIWADYPELAAGVLYAEGISDQASVDRVVDRFTAAAAERLGTGTESELPEIQAWRRTFARMGLKPTQYRCAAEALLRRFRKERVLPRIHPLVDLCNAISLAFAIPVAAFDVKALAGDLEVRYATGEEAYQRFDGGTEHPEPGEVIFADPAGNAHARRWTNRQSGASAVRATTSEVLVVAEAMHDTAAADVSKLIATAADELAAGWSVNPVTAVLSAASPRFEFGTG
ncbi:MAG TPA: phenylalanine--tRNA ligase beta subunit-related protein [Natronosporangium sp.]